MSYGTIKVDTITFTNNGVDQSLTVSGLVSATSGSLIVTGVISGATVQGGTLVSGGTVTGETGQFANLTAISGIFTTQISGATITGDIGRFTSLTGGTAGFTTVTGTTVTGTTANFVTLSGTSITGNTAGFTTVTGTTVTGTTANFVTLSGTAVTGSTAGFTTVTGTTVTGTTANFVTLSGTTVTGTTANFLTLSGTTVTGASGTFDTIVRAPSIVGTTTVSGVTVTGTTANFISGVFTTQVSGSTITGDIGLLGTVTGNTARFTSGLNAGTGTTAPFRVNQSGDITLDDGGSFTTTLQCVTPTGNQTISFPNKTGTIGLVAGANAQFIVNTSGEFAGTTNMTWSSGSGVRFTNSFGYGVGAGSGQTQSTNKSTSVTVNASCGQITMNNAALSGDTTVSFSLTNSFIDTGDVLILNHISGGTPGSYLLNGRTASGSGTIDVRNITTGSLSEAITIAFAVIKATTT